MESKINKVEPLEEVSVRKCDIETLLGDLAIVESIRRVQDWA